MRRFLLFLLVPIVILPALLFALVLWRVHRLQVAVAKGRWSPSWRVLAWSWVWCHVYRVPWDAHVAVLHNEGASEPRSDGTYPLGDQASSKGPSIGPGQVMRFNVERLWKDVGFPLRLAVVARDPLDLARVGHERQALWASVKILREAIDTAKGDVRQGIRRYNGSGDRAEAYADRAMSFKATLA